MKFTRFNITTQITTFIVFVVIAFLSYQKNFFGFADNTVFQTFDQYSESIVVGDIVADQFGLEKNGWNLGQVKPTGSTWEHLFVYKIIKEKPASGSIVFTPYTSQFGIQGLFFSKIYKFLDVPDIEVLNVINSLLMSFVIALLSVLFMNIYDRLFGLIFFVTMISSPWIVSFAKNLYWVPFTWFLPAIFAALVYISKGRAAKSFFLICILGSVAIKSLAGYEYLTVITLFACSVFILAPLFKNESRGKNANFKLASLTFLCCITGFLFALIIHAGMRGDSFISGLQNIYQYDIKRRTYGDPTLFDPIFRASLESSVWYVFNIYWSQWKTSIFMFIPGEYFGAMFWLSVSGVLYMGLTRRRISYKEPILVFVFFTASASWFLFGKSHSYVHPHLNFVLWYFGFVQALLYCLARSGLLIGADIFKLGKRLGLMKSSILSIFMFFIVFAVLTKYMDYRMTVVTSGVAAPLDIGSGFRVIFREDGKMQFIAPECRGLDLTERFFLHIFPEKVDLPDAMPYGFENRDFNWPKSFFTLNWNPLSNNYGSCYTEVSLPYYKIREIHTGQYYVNSTGTIIKNWEKTIKIPAFPNLVKLTPYNLTDQNWENGINLKIAGFFIENTLKNRMGLSTNNKILVPSSGERAITSIEYTDKYINIYLEGRNLDPVLDGYPNQLLIK